MARNRLSVLIGSLLPGIACGYALAQTPEAACQDPTNWANCGIAIRKEFEAGAVTPERAVTLAGFWGNAFDARYMFLRKSGQIEESTPDADKITDSIKDKVDPVNFDIDQAEEALVKKYLPRLAPVLEWASSGIVEAIGAFLNSSEIASDRKELFLMNDDLQKRIGDVIAAL